LGGIRHPITQMPSGCPRLSLVASDGGGRRPQDEDFGIAPSEEWSEEGP
jgi:hypothetical protein